MDSRYIMALEQRLRWLRWAEIQPNEWATKVGLAPFRYQLWYGDTYFMNSRFCQLVDHARRSIPDDFRFEREWLPTPCGWMWLEEPFVVPNLSEPSKEDYAVPILRLSAIGWTVLPEEKTRNLVSSNNRRIIPGAAEFACYQDADLLARDSVERHGPLPGPPKLQGGFSPWSHFLIQPGDPVMERIRDFEEFASSKDGGQGKYADSRASDMLHEIRWIYTAMHIMSEKLAMTVEHKADRATRRRLEKEKSPVSPLLKLITLRRMEEAHKTGAHGEVDWQWQWHVHGHWRNQWYPAESVHKTKWIEEYLKGPIDKPLKPPAVTVYRVER